MIIVTLSAVCTLKGMYQYNTNEQIVYVSKGSKEALTALTVLIVTHVTQVERVESGVCGFYTTLHTEYFYSICLLMLKWSKVSNTLYTGPLTPAIHLPS